MKVEPWHQTPWDWRAAIQFICGGTGTGLLFFTALAAWQEPARLARTGWLALAFVCVGLLFVWLKLGRRWRALFVILNPRTSWMSREALLSLPLLGLGLAAVWLRSPTIGLIAAVCGLCFLYAQAQMLKAARGIPAWREPLIVPLIFLTGLTEGASLLLASNLWLRSPGLPAVAGYRLQPEVAYKAGWWLPGALFLLLVIRLSVWVAYRRKLGAPGAAPVNTAVVLNAVNQAVLWPGHIIPLVVLLLAVILPAGTAILGLVAGLAALLAGWFLKFTIVARAAYNQGFALAHTPARTPGYGGPGTKPGWE
ncbi:MAG TPA: phenylacetyl-CoA:acceptor oxidoreductase [Anaerolineae bacterium]